MADDRAYWFDLGDTTGWKSHLEHEGFAVIKGVASAAEVSDIKELLWDDLERMDTKLRRDDPTSWQHLPVHPGNGICSNLAQSEGQWYVRGLATVRGVFEEIWGTQDLLASMDCVLLRQRGLLSPDMGTEGLHVDQNPIVKPRRECVQGMLPLLQVTPGTGGLEVVPRSHLDDSFRARLKTVHWTLEHQPLDDDWCAFRPDACFAPLDAKECADFYTDLERSAKLVLAEPGDLILWDSLLIHGGRVPDADAFLAEGDPGELGRMACTVAMTPRAFAVPSTIAALRRGEDVSTAISQCPQWSDLSDVDRDILAFRRRGFERGRTFNHCPHQRASTGTISTQGEFSFVRPVLSEVQERLVDGNATAPPQVQAGRGPWRPRHMRAADDQ